MNIVSLVGKVMGAGALVLAGSIASSSATVSMPLSCGIPTFDRNVDQGVFIWQDCATREWTVRAAGGPGEATFVGGVVSDQGFGPITPFSIESRRDTLDFTTDPNLIDFSLNVINGGGVQDGFSFDFPVGSNTCFMLESPVGARIEVGAANTPMPMPFDLETLGPCTNLPVRVSVNDVSVNENAGSVDVQVMLSQVSGEIISVDLSTGDETATAGADYSATTETVTFTPGDILMRVSIPILDDQIMEGDEAFTVTLSNPINATLGDSDGVVTIIDDESIQCGIPSFDRNVDQGVFVWQDCDTGEWNVRMAGGAGAATFIGSVVSDQPLSNIIPFSVERRDILDFTSNPNEIIYDLTVVNGGGVQDGFRFTIPDGANVCFEVESPVDARIEVGSSNLAIDDPFDLNTLGACDSLLPTVSIADTTVVENGPNGGLPSGTAEVTLNLSLPSTVPVTVNVSSVDGSATAGIDYQALPLTPITFAPGQIRQTLAIPILDDNEIEASETLSLILSQPTNADLGRASGLVVILDDEQSACGTPQFNRLTEQGVFIWQNCNTGNWRVRVTAGTETDIVNFAGGIDSDRPIGLVPFNIEGRDELSSPTGNDIAFSLNVANGGGVLDGFNFIPDIGAEACFRLDVPPNATIYLGQQRNIINAPIDLTTLLPCDGDENLAPQATPGNETTDVNTVLNSVVTGSDADNGPGPLTFQLIDSTNGQASIDPQSGELILTPDLDFIGLAEIIFIASDGLQASEPAIISVDITAPSNTAPVADAASFSTGVNTVLNETLTGSDADGDDLMFRITSNGSLGIAIIDETTGELTYTPDQGRSGQDTFTFVVNDGTVDSLEATVTVTIDNGQCLADCDVTRDAAVAQCQADFEEGFPGCVGDISCEQVVITIQQQCIVAAEIEQRQCTDDCGIDNIAPIANTAVFSTPFGAQLIETLSGSDSDGPDGLTFRLVSVDTGVDSVDIASDGSFVLTPSSGFSGLTRFVFETFDGLVASNQAVVLVSVGGNGRPTADPQSGLSTPFDTPFNGTLTGSDTEGAALTFAESGTAVGGSVSIYGASGNFTFTPAAGFTGLASFAFIVNDGTADSAPATVEITVGNGAVTAVDDTANTDANTNVDIPVLDNDSDANGDTLRIDSVAGGAGFQGVASITANNTVTYLPNGAFAGLAQGVTATDSFTYMVTDDNGSTASATVTVTIVGVNDFPVAVDDTETTDEDTAVNIIATANDIDLDGDDVEITIIDTQGTVGSVGIGLDQDTFRYDPNGQFDNLAPGATATDTFTYIATDGLDNSAPATVTVTITAVNDAPIATPQGPLDTAFETALPITLAGSDVDNDLSDLSFAISTDPGNGTITNLDPVAGTFTYTPNSGFSGQDSFAFTVSDGNLTSAAETVLINIAGPVDSVAPTANVIFPSPVSDTQGAATITLRGSASDNGGSGIVSVSVNGVAATTNDNFAAWQVNVPLTIDENTLSVTTTDAAGNTNTNAASVFVRNNPIFLSSPQSLALDRDNNRVLVVDSGIRAVIAVDLPTGQSVFVSR